MSESVYLIGESRTNLDNAITKIFNSFYLAFEVDPETDQILQFGCTHTVDLTEEFLSRLFVGRNLWAEGDPGGRAEPPLRRLLQKGDHGGLSGRHQALPRVEGSRPAAPHLI